MQRVFEKSSFILPGILATVIINVLLLILIAYKDGHTCKIVKDDDVSSLSYTKADRMIHQQPENLTQQIRVLVWVLTSPHNLDSRAIHIKKTWGRRCTVLLFFSSVENKTFPTIGVNTSEGRTHMTEKSVFAWNYVYKHYYDKADWFVKADDDTYVILENLRHFLSTKNTNEEIMFGHHFQTINKNGYLSGGAGHILSKAALKRYASTPLITKYCKNDGEYEDVYIGECMEKLGVTIGNSLDSQGRSRFHAFRPHSHIFGNYNKWYYSYDANGAKMGIDSISEYPITFHYIDKDEMYLLEFYIYHLKLQYRDSI